MVKTENPVHSGTDTTLHRPTFSEDAMNNILKGNVGKPLERVPRRAGFTEEEMRPYLTGELPLPNYEECKPEDLLPSIVGCVGSIYHSGSVQVPGGTSRLRPAAKFWLWRTQGQMFSAGTDCDGTGYVLYSQACGVKAGRFAMCEHEKLPRSDSQPSIGWHPGHCIHCGLDMTVDSGG